MSEVFTVFYCWQSDTPRRHCRDLVREAIDAAADAVSKDPSVPFRILVQSDTENEPGLCNIPETILRRLRESDAVISDLTFIATTAGPEPKHCSNPNVLFELGYCFAQLGPERLICVMNETHGPPASQIFDLAHHRRPISFCSPDESRDRSETVRSLARSLEPALRGVVKLGLARSNAGDDQVRHESHLAEIESHWRSNVHQKDNGPRVSIWFRPKLFREARWADVQELEQLLQRLGPRTDRFHRFPPQPTGNAPMDWGLYNDAYGDPWALTYAGQFWTELRLSGGQPLRFSERDLRVSPEPPVNDSLSESEWVAAPYALSQMGTVFQLARNFTEQFQESELFQLSFEASNLRDKWLHVDHLRTMGPCKAPKLRRNLEMPMSEFRQNWLEHFADVAKHFCDPFCRDGRVFTREELKHWINPAGELS